MVNPKPVRFRTQFDTDYQSSMFDTDIGEDDEYFVQQHMRDECDINVIMARYQATGELTHVVQSAQQFGDFSELDDYQSSLNQVMAAEALFMEIPARIRGEFDNDPGEFVKFATDPKNIEKLREWKLAPPPVVTDAEKIVEALRAEPKGGARTPAPSPSPAPSGDS